MFSNKEKAILNEIKKEKKEFFEILIKEKIIPKDLFNRIDKINSRINKTMNELINKDQIDMKIIVNEINKLILDKVYLNQINTSTNFLKSKFNLIKSQTKLNLQKELYNDGKIAKEVNEILLDKMDHFNSYYAIITDIIAKVKETKELIDTTIISLQSIMKNVSFEYINSNNINS